MINGVNAFQTNINTTTQNETVAQQLADLIKQYRDHMNDPNPDQLISILQKIQSLLTNNRNTIMGDCILNGYNEEGSDPGENYVNFFDQSLGTIQMLKQDDAKNPSAPLPIDTLDMFNEEITQLHFLMTTPNK